MLNRPCPAPYSLRRMIGICAITSFFIAAPALAETPIGEISGEIGGEAFVWETLDVPSEGTATAEFSEFGPVTTVSIQGHERGGESRMRNVVSLDFSLMGNDVMDIDVGFFPNGLSAPFYVSDDAPRGAEISFDTLDLAGDAGTAEGSFTALLCRKDGIMSPPDTSDCLEASGSFVTQLRPGL